MRTNPWCRRVAVRLALLAFALVWTFPSSAGAASAVQRFTLVIGANAAGGDRPQLRYAVSDAERFARVLVELGGVSRANEIVLKQPRVQDSWPRSIS